SCPTSLLLGFIPLSSVAVAVSRLVSPQPCQAFPYMGYVSRPSKPNARSRQTPEIICLQFPKITLYKHPVQDWSGGQLVDTFLQRRKDAGNERTLVEALIRASRA